MRIWRPPPIWSPLRQNLRLPEPPSSDLTSPDRRALGSPSAYPLTARAILECLRRLCRQSSQPHCPRVPTLPSYCPAPCTPTRGLFPRKMWPAKRTLSQSKPDTGDVVTTSKEESPESPSQYEPTEPEPCDAHLQPELRDAVHYHAHTFIHQLHGGNRLAAIKEEIPDSTYLAPIGGIRPWPIMEVGRKSFQSQKELLSLR